MVIMVFLEQYDLSEADVNAALKLNPVSKTLLRERANFLWNTKKSESKEAYERVSRGYAKSEINHETSAVNKDMNLHTTMPVASKLHFTPIQT